MADLITWTTPTITEAFDGIDLTGYTGYVTIEQTTPTGSLRARLTANATVTYDGETSYVTADYSQTQMGQLHKGRASVMVNVTKNGKRYASDPIDVMVALNEIPEEV